MINADTTLALGRSLVDGSPVGIGPSMGPVTVYGDTGSGKTVAARNLFRQLVANAHVERKPVIAVDGSRQGYADIAREYGGSSVTLSSERGSEVSGSDGGPSELSERHPIFTIDASALGTSLLGWSTEEADRDELRRMITEYLSQEPATHLIVDPLDHLLADPGCMDLLWAVMSEARSRNSMVVCVVFDPASVLAALNRDARVTLNAGSTLLMGANSHTLRRKKGIFNLIDPIMVDLAANHPVGCGLLSTPEGGLTTLAISPEENLASAASLRGPA